MDFNKGMSIICEVFSEQGMTIAPKDYDGVIIKRLEASNTLDFGRTTNQTHIAITGAQMDIFPYLKAEGYFSKDYDTQDNELKKYFITQIPVFLNKANIEYLNGEEVNKSIDFNGRNKKRLLTSIVRSRRKQQTDQIQMSLINIDSPEFVLFRKMIHSGDYLIVLKRKEILEYEFYGIKKENINGGSGSLNDLNNTFIKLPTNTKVDISTIRVSPTNKAIVLPHNRIIFGAPGTGKSHMLENEKLEFGNNVERVTFHPNYSFAQFVGTYKPIPAKDSKGNEIITYKYVPGPFMRTYVNSIKSMNSFASQPYLLIIEEINRANVAAVFGDVFQLLDRKDGNSEYEIQTSEDIKNYLAEAILGKNYEDCNNKERALCDKMGIPANMYIWATMNSADQGVFPMDTAFKRRWDFQYIGIDDGEKSMSGVKVTLGQDKNQETINWNQLRHAINNRLAERVDEDKLLGPYFLSKEVMQDSNILLEALKNKVLMYLFEDAARQCRNHIFKEDGHNIKRYSSICSTFDVLGIGVFTDEIVNEVRTKTAVEETMSEAAPTDEDNKKE